MDTRSPCLGSTARVLIACACRVLLSTTLSAALGSCGGGASGPPQLSVDAASPPTGATWSAYPGYTFTASGGTPPLSWSGTQLPPGLVMSAAGQLSGYPTTAGSYTTTVSVMDSAAPPQTASAEVTVKINDSSIVIASAAPPAGTVTYPYPGFAFSASGGSPPYAWKSSGALPPGLTLGSDGTVSGTPTKAGPFSFSVTATDSAQSPMTSLPLAAQITINLPQALMLSPTPAPPAGVVGTPYGPFAFTVSGGYQPLHWSITGTGNLPPGLTLGNDGSLSGTPALASSAGNYPVNYPFTVKVTDSASSSVSQNFTIPVTLPPPPTINSAEPPTGTVGSSYGPFQFTASNGVPPLMWSETGALATGLTFSAQGALSGTPTQAGQFPITTLNVTDAANRAAPPVTTVVVRVSLDRPPASFTPTGSMAIARSGHAATLLLSGKVLVTGGGNGKADPTAELYDPTAATFSSTNGNMTEARSGHTATLLRLSNPAAANYGKVLIVGSVDTSAELYDPSTGKFAATGSMHHPRTSPTATLLNTGLNKDKVLIVGGNTTSGDLVAELYDPASGTFSDTGSTTILRTGHTATLLLDLHGHVLVAGGGTATAELYDPSSGTFTPTAGNMTEARSGHTATLLQGAVDTQYGQNGYVLIIGTDGSADLYDPGTETFEGVGSLRSAFGRGYEKSTASLRNDGTVMIAGGYVPYWGCAGEGGTGNSSVSAALFAPESDGFTLTGSLHTARDTHTATVLQDGTVLVIGGVSRVDYFRRWGPWPFGYLRCEARNEVLSSAELFK